MTTFKPLNQYNAFFKLARERTLCGLDQLVGLHIQHAFNQAHWAETIQIADAELLECINWYDKTGNPTSLDSIRKAKARLKKKGFIDFEHGKGGKPTKYRLIQLYPPDTPADTPEDEPSDKERISYTAYTPKTFLDVKTRNEEERGREQEDELDALIDEWDKSACFCKLDFELISELKVLNDQYGAAAIRAAMAKARRGQKNGVSLNYFKAVLTDVGKRDLPVIATVLTPKFAECETGKPAWAD